MKIFTKYIFLVIPSFFCIVKVAVSATGLTPEDAMKASWPTVCSDTTKLGSELSDVCVTNGLGTGGTASDSSTATSAVLGNVANLSDKNQKDKVEGRLEELKEKSSGGTVSILDSERLGFFITGNTTQTQRITTDFGTGYESDDGGFIVGIDYFITNKWVAGFSVGYSNTDLTFNGDAGSTELDSVNTLLYTSYAVTDAFSLDGYLGWTGIEYDMARNVVFDVSCGCSSTFLGRTTGKTAANKVTTGLTAAYGFNLHSLAINPKLKLDYAGTFIDEFSEQEDPNNISGVALKYQDQDIHSLKTELGVDLDYAFSTEWGVILPHVGLSYVHEFLNDSRTIHTSFVQDLNTTPYDMAFVTDDPDRDYMVFSTGISTVLSRGIQIFLNYERVDLHKYIESYSVSGGVRVGF